MEEGNNQPDGSANTRIAKMMLSRVINVIIKSENEEVMSSATDDYKRLSMLLDQRFHTLEETIASAAQDKDTDEIEKMYECMTDYEDKYMEARKVIKNAKCNWWQEKQEERYKMVGQIIETLHLVKVTLPDWPETASVEQIATFGSQAQPNQRQTKTPPPMALSKMWQMRSRRQPMYSFN